jgi:hypothetical protein
MSARKLPLLVIPAAVAAIVGCGGSASQAQTAASAVPASAGVAAQSAPGAFTATELRGALLARINGAPAAVAPEAGAYGSLAEVKATKNSMHGVVVSPAKCAAATLTGFNTATFSGSPAAVATFRVGRNGVSEVLMAPSGTAAASALGRTVPPGCYHYHARVGGRTFSYQVHESQVGGIGDEARVLNVKAAGYPQVDVWSLVYRGSGIVGAITVVGPDASKAAVRQLGQQAYEYALKRLG